METLRNLCPVLRQVMLSAVLLAASASDLRRKRIPNRLLLAALAGRVLLSAVELALGYWSSVWEMGRRWLEGGILTLGLFILSLLLHGAFGLGDIKLTGIIALFVGAGEACRCFCRGLFLAAPLLLLLLAGKKIRKGDGIPFAPFLLAGYLLERFL